MAVTYVATVDARILGFATVAASSLEPSTQPSPPSQDGGHQADPKRSDPKAQAR